MKGAKMLTQVREAISNLNPHDVRDIADRPFALELYAADNPGYWKMERFFVPAEASVERRAEIRRVIFRAGEANAPSIIRIYEEGMTPAADGFVFDPDNPERTVEEILEKHQDLSIALARRVCPFRPPVVKQIIRTVSKENALFSVATAVPAVLPLISLPWAVGEFASDTAFLTANQMRMAFQLAAASDREVGYKKQRSEIASLIAGAFGWRALARELVGHIPMGGGLIPKAAVAYAGTYVVGLSLERYYRLGYHFTREERKHAYEAAFDRGKQLVSGFLEQYRTKHKAS